MKRNKLWELSINPFIRIAGWQAFFTGLFIVALAGLLGYFGNIFFDGAIDIHPYKTLPLKTAFGFLAVDMIVLVFVMNIAGLTIAKNFRFVDILGTMFLAKAPYLLVSIVAIFTGGAPDPDLILHHPTMLLHSFPYIILLLTTLLVIIWSITLMYNAMKISCDVKGEKLTVTFIIAVIIAEIISKVIISNLTKTATIF